MTTGFSLLPLVAGLSASLLLLFPIRSAAVYMYPFAFMNTSIEATTASASDGKVQILACSNNPANMDFSTYYGLRETVVLNGVRYNNTFRHNELVQTAARTEGVTQELPYGLLITSDVEANVYGSKMDEGSTDTFLVPLLTTNSTEFYMAGWAGKGDSGLIIASACSDNCIEIYAKNKAGQYKRWHSTYLDCDHMVTTAFANDTDDTTGLYINSSKPINLFAGVASGHVPNGRPYGDYMGEHIPPVSELGTTYVVPSILGRTAGAGYFVRVVATKDNTSIDWSPTSLVRSPLSRPVVTARGDFVEINVNDASAPLLVTCSEPCVVMQYNKGFSGSIPSVKETTRTDPFIMVATPADHFVNSTCFPTTNYYHEEPALGQTHEQLHDFVNYVSIVTETANTGSIQLDGGSVSSWKPVDGYSVAAVAISHGWHTVTTTSPTATFAAYVYGHEARAGTSFTAYGNNVGYKVLGTPVTDCRKCNQNTTSSSGDQGSSGSNQGGGTNTSSGTGGTSQNGGASCQLSTVKTGSAVVNYPNATHPEVIRYALHLEAPVESNQWLSPTCVILYTNILTTYLTSTFMDINTRICQRQLCSYLYGVGPGVQPGNLFAAIDATTPNYDVSIEMADNLPTKMRLMVPFAGIFDTNLEAFGHCRTEIRQHLASLSNWLFGTSPGSNQLTPPTNCPQLTFTSNVTAYSPACPYDL